VDSLRRSIGDKEIHVPPGQLDQGGAVPQADRVDELGCEPLGMIGQSPAGLVEVLG
jgi:hypothetical protein